MPEIPVFSNLGMKIRVAPHAEQTTCACAETAFMI
jgi:hypothetical protein